MCANTNYIQNTFEKEQGNQLKVLTYAGDKSVDFMLVVFWCCIFVFTLFALPMIALV